MADLTEEQRLRNEIDRADKAKALLGNSLLKSAFDDVEHGLLSAMENTHDADLVQKLHFMFVANRKVQNTITTYIETGKLAAFQLDEKRKRKLWSIS